MQALERGEMPAAPQPGGLSVTMRPYQLQSLQFMLDAERGEGGETPSTLLLSRQDSSRGVHVSVRQLPCSGACALSIKPSLFLSPANDRRLPPPVLAAPDHPHRQPLLVEPRAGEGEPGGAGAGLGRLVCRGDGARYVQVA